MRGRVDPVMSQPSCARLEDGLRVEVGVLQRLRFANRFLEIEDALPELRDAALASGEPPGATNWALDAVELSLLTTRAATPDIIRAETVLKRSLGSNSFPEHRALWNNKKAVLLQERATMLWLDGQHDRAADLQRDASDFFSRSRRIEIARWGSTEFESIRESTLRHKFTGTLAAVAVSDDLIATAEQYIELGDTAPLRFLSDAAMIGRPPSYVLIEILSDILARQLQRCGYGQDFDLTAAVMLKRRLWCLLALLGWFDRIELEQDVATWLDWGLFNEVREVAVAFDRKAVASRGVVRQDALAAREHLLTEIRNAH
jgi:hypothetical protein